MDRGLAGAGRRVADILSERFSAPPDSEVFVGFVPGRIEVLGKHTDYAGGHSIVCAIDRGFLFAARANPRGIVRIEEDSSEFPGQEFPLRPGIQPTLGSWANYPMTMAERVAANFSAEKKLSGVDIAFSSTLPVGSGMSGSSALMIMVFSAICSVNRLEETAAFRRDIAHGIDLAMYLACGENGQSFRGLAGGKGVGTFGGSEDHTAILNCRAGMLSLYRYAPTVFKAEMDWPGEWALVVAFSGIHAEKTREALEKYNLASRRASLAVKSYNRSAGTVFRTLGDIAEGSLAASETRLLGQVRESARERRELALADRMRHFLLEERRHMPRAVAALLWRNLKGFGAALTASHRASGRYLWNIVPEIDSLRRSALRLGASGATGFGAGFGGSIVAVVPASSADSFLSEWRRHYAESFPGPAASSAFFRTSPSPGLLLWGPDGPSRWVDILFSR
jgi:galactokinase